jgi:O-antigen/teichoic acid export membrane protein
LELDDSYLPLAFTISEFVLFIALISFVYSCLLSIKAINNIWSWFPKHLSFGLRGAFSGILIELNTRLDVLMLGYFGTDAMVGVYSFAAMLAEGFGQIPLAIRYNVDPIMGGYFADGTGQKINELARKIRRVFYPVMGLVGGISVVLYPIFLNRLAPNQAVISSSLVFAIIMLGVVVGSGYRPFSGILLQGGRPGVYTIFILSLVLGDALLNLLFIPWLGIYGAATVTALTYTLEAIYLIVFVRILFCFNL